MAAPSSGLHFCTMGGSAARSSIFHTVIEKDQYDIDAIIYTLKGISHYVDVKAVLCLSAIKTFVTKTSE